MYDITFHVTEYPEVGLGNIPDLGWYPESADTAQFQDGTFPPVSGIAIDFEGLDDRYRHLVDRATKLQKMITRSLLSDVFQANHLLQLSNISLKNRIRSYKGLFWEVGKPREAEIVEREVDTEPRYSFLVGLQKVNTGGDEDYDQDNDTPRGLFLSTTKSDTQVLSQTFLTQVINALHVETDRREVKINHPALLTLAARHSMALVSTRGVGLSILMPAELRPVVAAWIERHLIGPDPDDPVLPVASTTWHVAGRDGRSIVPKSVRHSVYGGNTQSRSLWGAQPDKQVLWRHSPDQPMRVVAYPVLPPRNTAELGWFPEEADRERVPTDVLDQISGFEIRLFELMKDDEREYRFDRLLRRMRRVGWPLLEELFGTRYIFGGYLRLRSRKGRWSIHGHRYWAAVHAIQPDAIETELGDSSRAASTYCLAKATGDVSWECLHLARNPLASYFVVSRKENRILFSRPFLERLTSAIEFPSMFVNYVRYTTLVPLVISHDAAVAALGMDERQSYISLRLFVPVAWRDTVLEWIETHLA